MQDWEYTTNELIHYAEGQNELLHYRTKGALNKKVAQYIRDGGKLINGKIVYAKKALRGISDRAVKGIDSHLDRYNYHNSKGRITTGYDAEGRKYTDYTNAGSGTSRRITKSLNGKTTTITDIHKGKQGNRSYTVATDKTVDDTVSKTFNKQSKKLASLQKQENVALHNKLKQQKTKDKLKYALKSTGFAIKRSLKK